MNSSKALLTKDDLVSAPIETGDCGIIIKADLSIKIFSTHKLDQAEGLTPEQEEQGAILYAFAVASKFPEVMELLKTMSVDPKIVGAGIDLGSLQ